MNFFGTKEMFSYIQQINMNRNSTDKPFVYHGSSRQGLSVILPNTSTHFRNWVYASREKVVASAFLNTWGGDFGCSIGRDYYSGIIYICERQPDAFEKRYAGKEASLYKLPGTSFEQDDSCWIEELISKESVIPFQEEKINDVASYLENFQREGKLIIKRFPEKISLIPSDDSDLLRKALKWTSELGEEFLQSLAVINPPVFEKVLSHL